MPKPFVVLSGTSHPVFAKRLAKELNVPLGKVEIAQFSDSETHIIIHEEIKGKEVFIVQSGYAPTNHYVMETAMLVEAASRQKPKRITVVLPFMPYRRQEKITMAGESLTFDLIARIFKTAGAQRVLTIDLHKHRSRRFFEDVNISCSELRAFPVIVDYFQKKGSIANFVVVAPDKGSIPESEKYARALHVPLVKFFKHRAKRDQIIVDRFEGEVKGKNVLIIDDEVNTAGTLQGVVDVLKKNGARFVYFACTHGVLSGPAIERLSHTRITQVVITDTIPLRGITLQKLKVLSVAPLFAERIKRWVA